MMPALLAAAAQFNGPAQLVAEPAPGGESISIAADDATVSLAQGATVNIVYTLTRLGGYTGTVTPVVTGLPTGVTGAWSDSALAGGDTTTTLVLTAASDAGLVTDDAFVATFSGAGVDDAIDNGAVTVTTALVTPDWEVVRNFNSGTDGGATQGQPDGFDDLAGASKYSTEQYAEGGVSCKMTIAGGAEGFGNWGGLITLSADQYKGDQTWLRFNIYKPTGFVISTPGNGSLKTVRFHQKHTDNSNAGYFDWQMRDDVGYAAAFRMIKEGDPNLHWVESGTAGDVTFDMWHEFAFCIKWDNVLQSSGGTSRIRMWQNSALVVDDATIQTLVNATDRVDALYLFTYWNGNAPQTQSLYVDDIRIAGNGTPSWATSLAGVS